MKEEAKSVQAARAVALGSGGGGTLAGGGACLAHPAIASTTAAAKAAALAETARGNGRWSRAALRAGTAPGAASSATVSGVAHTSLAMLLVTVMITSLLIRIHARRRGRAVTTLPVRSRLSAAAKRRRWRD